MFYRLAKRLRLRGWQHLTTVLVDSLGRRVRILSKQEFAVLVLCDGETEMESVLNNPESKEIIRDFEEKKYIIPSEGCWSNHRITRNKYGLFRTYQLSVNR